MDAGLSCGTGAPSWQGSTGTGGVYYKTGVGLIARRTDNTEIVLNSPSGLYANATPISSVTTGEIDAHVYTMPGGTMFADGQRLQITIGSTHAANTNSATYKLYIGGFQLLGQVRATSNEQQMSVVTAVRSGAGAMRWHATIVNGSSLTVATNNLALDYTVPIIIKTAVDGPTAAGDEIMRFLRIEFWP
jgi:hypothetical protein